MDTKLTILAACGVALATALATIAACTAPPAPAAPSTASVTVTATRSTVLRSLNPNPPRPNQRAAFLAALDRDHVPHSTIGDAEVLIGVGTCRQIQTGRDTTTIASELSSTVGWSLEQATSVVNDARATLC